MNAPRASALTRWTAIALPLLGLLNLASASAGEVPAPDTVRPEKKPKYYFKVIEAIGLAGAENEAMARELVSAELSRKPEFLSVLEGVQSETDLLIALKKQKLRGFEVSLRVEPIAVERKEPRPGSRLPQLSISIKLTLYGSEIPTKKLAFSGSGESMQIAEVFEKRIPEETKALTRDVMTDAIKQAIDQAVLKLALPSTSPGPIPAKKGRKKRAS
ncbi:MAG: hypothetical protein SGI86_22780 [Deltaproteobacteria bacterium]|nr:hypothetical protein [Deltaproteobacteria bacterium]